MTSIPIDPTATPRIQPHYFCRNGQLVSANGTSRMGEVTNQIARYRLKELFRGGGDCTSLSRFRNWRWACHIGPMTDAIVVRAYCASTVPDSKLYSPAVTLTVADSSGNTLASGSAFGGYAFGALLNDGPDEWFTSSVVVSAAAFRNTSVRCSLFAQEHARVISVVVYEVSRAPDSDNGYVRQQYQIGDTILDDDRGDMQALAISLYKRGAAHGFNFSADEDGEAPKNTTLGTVNVLDNASTLVTDATPGVYLDLRYCNRKTSTRVPCRFEAYLATDSGASLQLRLRDAYQNDVAILTANSATPGWYQTTADLPATFAKYDLMYTSSGAQGITCYAASLYQYAT